MASRAEAEAERLLVIAEKLLHSKDFNGSRDFAILAQETEPLLDGSDQILAVAEVLLAADSSNKKNDWYSILQIPNRTNDDVLIRKQYRRLALLLHPDKNKFPFADSAFALVADAWAVLSDPAKKLAHDSVSTVTKVDLVANKRNSVGKSNTSRKLPVRRSGGGVGPSPSPAVAAAGVGVGVEKKRAAPAPPPPLGNFWTVCPYCYNLYEYPREYDGCCLRCDSEKCRKTFTGVEVTSLHPLVPGREAYYCCWGVFPIGFRLEGQGGGGGGGGFPKWMPPMFGGVDVAVEEEDAGVPLASTPTPTPTPPAAAPVDNVVEEVVVEAPASGGSSGKKKRGRPRRNW